MTEITHDCQFCGSVFNSRSTLITHKKTAKYCLSLRDKTPVTHSCELCFKEFTLKSNLKAHSQRCHEKLPENMQKFIDNSRLKLKEAEDKSTKLEEENAKMKVELKALKKKLSKMEVESEKAVLKTEATIYKEEYKAIRDKPTTVYNTTNNKLKLVNTATIEPFTVETVRNRLNDNKYTYGDFMSGLNGIKRFIMGIITKDDEKNYVTTDTSRPNFHRLEDTKKWIGDKGALFLNELFDEMKPVVQEHWQNFSKELNEVESADERDVLIMDLDRVKPVASAILSKNDSKQRKELMEDVIKYIKPRVAI